MPYNLGTEEATVQLIEELYIDLKQKVNKWSDVTKQTPQARMGYVGQHLVSVVTGYPGGRSGARGHDLELPDGKYGEIKTCYKVDQLGSCNNCSSAVSSIEKTCPMCGSTDIERKDDSKWLITIRNDDEFSKFLDPYRYYFVLFDYEDISDVNNDTIIASIWEVDPKNTGFAYCLFDYYLNIRSKSKSKAPFNMWPYSLKFQLTKPKLIFKCAIKDDEVTISIFPGKSTEEYYLDPMEEYASAKTLDIQSINAVISAIDPHAPKMSDKKKALKQLEALRIKHHITDDQLIDVLVNCIYLPLLSDVKEKIPENYKPMHPRIFSTTLIDEVH